MSIWTPDAITRFRQLLAEGRSARDIAPIMTRDFGVEFTVGSCNGKAWRLGRPQRDRIVTVSPHPRRAGNWIAPFAKPAPRKAVGTLDIMDLDSSTCRWPFGDRPPYLYCGDTPFDGSPYCRKHTKLAWAPYAVRERRV
jgi:hypothetical protein